ncbi:hypothetical protein TURU_079378 [Turdus rufiventris]|nr:hypothetical protein TURU_079378 [Turdus rufiventris]
MSSYFVNPLYSKYKVAAAAAAAAAGEAINSPYYDCHFAPEAGDAENRYGHFGSLQLSAAEALLPEASEGDVFGEKGSWTLPQSLIQGPLWPGPGYEGYLDWAELKKKSRKKKINKKGLGKLCAVNY